MISLFKIIRSVSQYVSVQPIKVLILFACGLCSATGYSQVVINEVLASNSAVYSDRLAAQRESIVKIDIEHLTKGIYFVVLKTDCKVLTEKIIHL